MLTLVGKPLTRNDWVLLYTSRRRIVAGSATPRAAGPKLLFTLGGVGFG